MSTTFPRLVVHQAATRTPDDDEWEIEPRGQVYTPRERNQFQDGIASTAVSEPRMVPARLPTPSTPTTTKNKDVDSWAGGEWLVTARDGDEPGTRTKEVSTPRGQPDKVSTPREPVRLPSPSAHQSGDASKDVRGMIRNLGFKNPQQVLATFSPPATSRPTTAADFVLPSTARRSESPFRPFSPRRSQTPTPRHASPPPPAAGAKYKFYLPGALLEPPPSDSSTPTSTRPALRPFDVFCAWDTGEKELEVDQFADGAKFHRQFYTFHLVRKPPQPETSGDRDTWQHFLDTRDKMGEVALEKVVQWCAGIRPRSVHDYKPLVVLLQEALKLVLAREMTFFSEEIKRLRTDRTDALKMINNQQSKISELSQKPVTAKRWQTVKRVSVWNNMQTQKQEMSDKIRNMEKDLHNNEQEREQQKKAEVERQAKIEHMAREVEERSSDLEDALEALKVKTILLHAEKEKNKKLQSEMGELRKQLHSLQGHGGALSKELKEARVQRFQKAGLQVGADHLRNQLDLMRDMNNTPFMSWAAYRPVVDAEWAAALVSGQASLSVPWKSIVLVPKESQLPFNAHILEVPGGSVIHTPVWEGSEQLRHHEHTIAVPAFSRVAFPEKGGRGLEGDLFTVSVPGGTSVILPRHKPRNRIVRAADVDIMSLGRDNEGEFDRTVQNEEDTRNFHLILGPGVVIYPPVIDDNDNNDDLDRTDINSHDADIIQIPRGGSQKASIAPGSTLTCPMGSRSSINVPTNCTFIFPVGQKRHMTVPEGSSVHLQDGGHSIVMIPCRSEVRLPDYDDWQTATEMHQDAHARNEHVDEDESSSDEDEGPVPPPRAPAAARVGRRNNAMPALYRQKSSNLQMNQPDCVLSVPGGSVVVLPDHCPYLSGEFKVTLPPHSRVLKQDGAAEETENILPETRLIPKEARIETGLPQGMSLAQRMKQLGPEACAAALGALDPHLASKALSDSALDAKLAATILTLARSQAAAQVLCRLNPTRMTQVVSIMNPDVVGMMLGELRADEVKEVEEVLDHAWGTDRTLHIVRDSAARVHKASDLLASQGPIRKVVDSLLKLDPRVAGRLIAAAPANKAGYTLSRMAGRRFGSDHASRCAEELHKLASNLRQLGTRYHAADITTARLVEDLSKAVTEASLFDTSLKCMRHLKQAYGIRCTLTRMPQASEVELEKLAKDRLQELLRDLTSQEVADKRRRISIRGKKKTMRATMRAVGTKCRAVRRVEEMMESKAEDDIELLCSTEAVSWGSDKPVPGQFKSPEDFKYGLSVHMRAKVLQDAIEEAFSKKAAVFQGSLLVMPIILDSGVCWGALSHINRNSASEHIMGGLGQPSTNSVPKAYEALQLMATAFKIAVQTIEVTVKQVARQLTEHAVTCSYSFVDGILEPLQGDEEISDVPSVCREQVAVRLQSYMHWRRVLSAELILGFGPGQETHSALVEMKGYTNPPPTVVRLMVAMFISLDVGMKEYEALLGDDLQTYPSGEAAAKMWKHTRALIKVDPLDKDNLPRLMHNASKGLAQLWNNSVPEEDIIDDQKRVKAIEMVMEPLKREVVERSSKACLPLLDWCYVQFRITALRLMLVTEDH